MEDYDAILRTIRRITRAIDLHSKRMVKATGMTVPQLLILQCIAETRKASIGAVAARVNLSQATVTSVVDRLQSQGLVTRERSGEDKRVVLVRLTADGERKLETAPEPMQAGFIRAFQALEPWERHMLLSALERVAVMMDAGHIDASPILALGELETAPPEPTDAA